MPHELPVAPAAAGQPLTIRSHLFLLALAAVVPILAFAVAVSLLLVENTRELIRTTAMDRARAILSAVDAELRGSITTLEAMATLQSIRAGDLRAFHAEAIRIQPSQQQWRSINLATVPGFQQVANSAVSLDQKLHGLSDQPSALQVVGTRQPAVGSVTTGPLLKTPLVALRVPVIRDGVVAYILSALIEPSSFESLIQQQKLPKGWVIGIVDGQGRFVARIPPRAAGSMAGPKFLEAMRNAPEGWYRGATVEGLDTYTAHMTSAYSGWTVGLALPVEFVEAGAQRTIWLLGIGALASVVIALLAAMLIGRRISGPVIALAASARAIGSGAVVRGPGSERVREVAEVAAALDHSAEAVRERQALIEREKAALQEADRAKDEFIAMLSHELRNPLSALTAAAHLLKMSGLAASATEHARGVIERQTRHMTRLIEDLLDVNRVVMGKATLIREPLDLAELVSEVVRTWSQSGRLANHRVEVDASPVTVDADRSRIEQVFSNLLENALKFTPAGRSIAVSVGRQAGEAVLTVADEGQGIDRGMIDRVFGLFVQGPQPLDRQSGGLGLGLALVRGLADLHGGSVSVSSDGPGRGACFTLRLPAVSADPTVPPMRALGRRARGVTRSIVIVEDNDDARGMLKVMLELDGHCVREAADAATGLALAVEEPPDVMIVDIGLPDMDGYELAGRIRATPWGGRVILIALTGYGQAEDKRRALAAGFDAHATKPVLPEQLELLIDAAGRAPQDKVA